MKKSAVPVDPWKMDAPARAWEAAGKDKKTYENVDALTRAKMSATSKHMPGYKHGGVVRKKKRG